MELLVQDDVQGRWRGIRDDRFRWGAAFCGNGRLDGAEREDMDVRWGTERVLSDRHVRAVRNDLHGDVVAACYQEDDERQ